MKNTVQKINGYSTKEAQELIEYVADGKKQGKSLCYLFEGFASSHARAAGSVRNYYYSLLKSNNESAKTLVQQHRLCAEKANGFTNAETYALVRDILTEKAKGLSVRQAIFSLCGDDVKKGLRLQNKFRNLQKKQPELITSVSKELGLPTDGQKKNFSLLQRRAQGEINKLLDRLLLPYKEENARLKEENIRLKRQLQE